jgi:hypothetical protein
MMDEFIHWPILYLLLSRICDEMLSWVIKIYKKNHLVNDSNYNTINLESPQILQGMTNNVGLTSSVGDTTPRFTISIEQDN